MSDPQLAAMAQRPPRLPNLRGERPAPPSAPAPEPAAEQAPPPAPWKYTVLLTEDDRQTAVDLEAAVVRRAGIRRTKGMRAELLRALFALAAEDEQLQERLAARLRDATTG
jgi:hypothetical protein